MKKILLLFCCCLSFAATFAQIQLSAPDQRYYIISEDPDRADFTIISKYNSNGTPDLTYGNMGVSQLIAIDVVGAALQTDGKILLGGTTQYIDFHTDRVIARINTDGTIASYSTESATLLSYDFMTSFEVVGDKVVIIGYSASVYGFGVYEIRILSLSGKGDIFYSGPAINLPDVFRPEDFHYQVYFQGDQTVIAGSQYYEPMDGITPARFIVESTLFNANGSVDLKSKNVQNIQDPYTGKYGLILQHYNADGSPDIAFNDKSLQTLQYLFDAPLSITSFERIGDKIVVTAGTIRLQFNADGSFDKLPGDEVQFTFTCPRDTVVGTATGNCTAIVNGLAPATSVDGSLSAITYSLSGATTGNGTGSASGVRFNKGVTTVVYNETNNPTNNCSFTVTVQDKQAPVIAMLATNLLNIWPPDNKWVNVFVNYNTSDNCGTVNTTLSVSSNETSLKKDNENDCVIVNNHQVKLRAEKGKKPKDRVYIITVTAIDAAGNRTTKSIKIGVEKEPAQGFITYNKTGANRETEDGLQVKVLPNPSSTYFIIKTSSSSQENLKMRVHNEAGTVIETRTGLPASGQLQVGGAYRNGFYLAEFVQGLQRVSVKLLKQQ